MRRIKYCIPEDSMNPKKEAFHIERDSNLNLITNIGDGQVINFKFDGYTKTKGLIKPLANNCCAYCGDRIANNTVTVEHFRPKKSLRYRKNEFIIKNGEYQATNTLMEKSKYGYFLWGSHYKNLLPACEACNTGRGDQGIYINGNLTYDIPYGKKNNFPILFNNRVDPRHNSIYVKSIKGEYPLLFNPYLDNPRELFDYKLPKINNDQVVLIRPNKKVSKIKRLKAEMTINLLGLNRQSLCHRRGEIISNISLIIREFMSDCCSPNPQDRISAFASHASAVSRLNSLSDASLLGFTRTKSKLLVKTLHQKVKVLFPSQSARYLTDTVSFYNQVEELRKFSMAYSDMKNDFDILNAELANL